QQIIHDPIAINEYLGTTFNEPALGVEPVAPPRPAETRSALPPPTLPLSAAARKPDAAAGAEQEKIERLVETLKTADFARAAAELIKCGSSAVPALMAALDRRDVEMRRQALQVLQAILKRPVVFDPYAPEILRKQQLVSLRDQFERKAG